MLKISRSILLSCFLATHVGVAVAFSNVKFGSDRSLSRVALVKPPSEGFRNTKSTRTTIVKSEPTTAEPFLSSNATEINSGFVESSLKVAKDRSTGELLGEIGEEVEKLDIVEAILAASEDAVAAAEASLPADLKTELSFGSLSVSNGTDVSVAAENLSNQAELPTIVSASEIVGDPVTRDNIETPSVLKILKFAVPAMGVWLCSPLLSMIDTSAVGTLSGTIQQAALNPAVAVTDYAALCIAFLYTATTNMVAAARESERKVLDKPETTKAMVGAMQLSTYVGAGLGAVLFLFARQLLKAIIGNDAIDPAVFGAAMKYVKIRALGMPAAAIIGSAQAACLGMQDIKSPLYVLAVAAIVNYFGDMIFVGSTHPLIGGAAGAAWATVFSQYAALALFMGWLLNKPKAKDPVVLDLTSAIMELTGDSSDGESRRDSFRKSVLTRLRSKRSQSGRVIGAIKQLSTAAPTFLKKRLPNIKSKFTPRDSNANYEKNKEDSFSVRGLLAGKASAQDILKFPSKEISDTFLPYVVPVTTTQVGRVSGYVAMSHVVSSAMGTVSMAAQQILVSLFYCLAPIADSLNLTAQSFVPAIWARSPSKNRAASLKKITRNFTVSGIAFGGIMAGIVGMIPLLSRFFTSDPIVIHQVNMAAPYLALFFSVHGVMSACEGLLLGQKDLSFLGKMYAGYFFAVPFFMLRVKRAALAGAESMTLNSVWQVFVSYQLFRVVCWLFRVSTLNRRAEREASVQDGGQFQSATI